MELGKVMNINELFNLFNISVLSEYRGSHSAEDPNAPKTFGVTKNSILHIWSDHSMAVTGIATSGCGYNRKIATSSLDQTCKVNLRFYVKNKIFTFLFFLLFFRFTILPLVRFSAHFYIMPQSAASP